MHGSRALATAKPHLHAGVEIRGALGHVALVSGDGDRACDLLPGEQAVLALLDGSRDLRRVAVDALALTPAVRPAATLGLLRRLYETELLEGLSETAARELGAQPPARGVLPLLRRLTALRVPLPTVLGAPFAAVGFGRRAAASLAAVGLVGTALAALGLMLTGELERALDPFAGGDLRVRAGLLYLATALLASCRGVFRAAGLAGAGLEPRLALALTMGVLHLDVDDRARRWLAPEARGGLYLAGLAGLAVPTALGLLDRLVAAFVPHGLPDWLAATVAVAPFVLVLDLAPYGRGDGWNLAGVWARVPDLRRRSAAFLLRRSVRNVLRSEPIGGAERTYLLLGTAWLGHALLSGWLLTEQLLPSTLGALRRLARGTTGDPLEWAIGVALAVGLLAVALALGIGLLVVIGSAVAQLFAGRPAAPAPSVPIGEADDDVLDAMAAVPFLANLPREELRPIVAGMRRETYRDGQAIVRQGDEGDRFCLLHAGEAEVAVEDESGARERLASLRAGDFFGEIALLEARPRTATVVARGEVTVLSLDRTSFVSLVEHSNVAREAVLEQVRNAGFLRTVDVFSHAGPALLKTLLDAVEVLRVGAGEVVVEQGDDGDALFVVREGGVRVERREGDNRRTLDELGPGEIFGEIALLAGVARTATVITTAETMLLRLPGAALDTLLLDDLRVAASLEAAMQRRRIAHGGAEWTSPA